MTNYIIPIETNTLQVGLHNKLCGIYLIKNRLTNQLYIGQSRDILRRWYEHCKDSRSSFRIDRAIKKYTPDNFKLYILKVLPENKLILNEYEQYFIKIFKTFDKNDFHYNMTPGGEGLGYKEDHPNYKGKIIDDAGGIDYLKKSKASGKSLEDMLNEFKISDKAFYNYLKDQGYTGWHELTGKRESSTGVNHYNYKQQLIKDAGGLNFIKSCKIKGLSKQEVSDNLGVSIFVLDNYLKQNKVNWESLTGKRESSSGKNHTDCKWQIIDDAGGMEYIIKSEASNNTLENLLEEFNIGHKSFYRYLKEHGYSGWYDLGRKRKFKIIDDAGGISYLKQSKKSSKTMKSILNELNISERLLNNYLKAHNYKNWSKL
ncbi:MAG: GIY-YIG nuclease family protein [Methanobrevibacter sp.]|nr:GIY-YIG nuclease family protein [Methanobrevibacter sp.]